MDEEKQDLTPNEAEIKAADGVSADEAHSIGEFDELRELISDVLSAIVELKADFAAFTTGSVADAVADGANITIGEEALEELEDAEVKDVEDLDFTM